MEGKKVVERGANVALQIMVENKTDLLLGEQLFIFSVQIVGHKNTWFQSTVLKGFQDRLVSASH